MKISVLNSQPIIQVFRLIKMLLSRIYTFVYFGMYCIFLRRAIHRYIVKKGMVIPCASSSEVDKKHCSPFSCTVLLSCYYGFINIVGEGQGMDKGKGSIG